MSAERHDPTFMATGRHGCWATCVCGWKSPLYASITGAVLAHGEHLAETENAT